MRRAFGATAALAACLFLAGNSFAIGYVKLGEIKGESTDSAHQDWIDVLSWKMSEGNPKLGQGCGNRPPGEFVFTKLVDSATPEILRALTECKDFRDAYFDVPIGPEAGTEAPERVMRVRFGPGLRVVRVEAGSPTADDRPTEEITIVYNKVEIEILETERDD